MPDIPSPCCDCECKKDKDEQIVQDNGDKDVSLVPGGTEDKIQEDKRVETCRDCLSKD